MGIIIAAVTATFLWGSTFPMIKLSYEALHIKPEDVFEQLLIAGYRFFLAALLIMGFITLLGRKIRYQKGTVSGLMTIALFQTFRQYVFFYIELSYSTGVQGESVRLSY